ncbi:MAG: GHMP kinase [Proteobacteria bacterium]|nr:GHMP kinase [Pseudomonadota bacterium]
MIISKTPFRVSFVGGGTDLAEFYSVEPGAVVSASIDRYMYICVNKRFDHTIRVSYSKTEIVETVDEIQHPIVKECLKLTGVEDSIEVTSVSDIPAGTGLGSSSSFTVGLLHALYAYKGIHVTPERLASEACRIEIDILKEPIGKQDQYIAAYGGLQFIRFNPDGTVYVDPILCTKEVKKELSENLMFFYTGVSRQASTILTEQKKNTAAKMEHLKKVRDLTPVLRDVLTEGGALTRFGKLLNEGWVLKKSFAEGISNAGIDESYARALEAGAVGGKLLGAGGGGFLLFYVEQQNQAGVREALKDLREVPFSFEPQGSKIIHVGMSAW